MLIRTRVTYPRAASQSWEGRRGFLHLNHPMPWHSFPTQGSRAAPTPRAAFSGSLVRGVSPKALGSQHLWQRPWGAAAACQASRRGGGIWGRPPGTEGQSRILSPQGDRGFLTGAPVGPRGPSSPGWPCNPCNATTVKELGHHPSDYWGVEGGARTHAMVLFWDPWWGLSSEPWGRRNGLHLATGDAVGRPCGSETCCHAARGHPGTSTRAQGYRARGAGHSPVPQARQDHPSLLWALALPVGEAQSTAHMPCPALPHPWISLTGHPRPLR